MADAYVVRSDKMTAGIVVAEQQSFRFYASESLFFPLDGQLFSSVLLAQKAAETLHENALRPVITTPECRAA